MSYPKYQWVGNRISKTDMSALYRLKQETKKPITVLVSEAVSQFLKNQAGSGSIKILPIKTPDYPQKKGG